MKLKAAGLMATIAVVLSACGVTTSESESSSGLGDAIGITGAWTIDVSDADGSLDQHVEFHNEFVGQAVLADLLALTDTHSGWYVSVKGLADNGSATALCDVASTRCSGDATAARDVNTNELVVTFSFTPDFTANVYLVDAGVDTTSTGNQILSTKDLRAGEGGPGVVPVGAGQLVSVEIRYTFSSI